MKELKLMRELRHDNVNSFIGAIVESHSITLITDYCDKGSLEDILHKEDMKLENMVTSLVHDLVKGVQYLHGSNIGTHGNLRSSNCVITSRFVICLTYVHLYLLLSLCRWTLKVGDFGLHDLRHASFDLFEDEGNELYRQLWKPPELLRDAQSNRVSKKGTENYVQ